MMKDLLGDTFSLDASPSYKLYRTARLIRSDLNQLFQSLETVITPEQWVLLFRLNEKDGQSQCELSDRFFKDPPNITRMLDALVKHRFVVRVPDARDRRRFLVYLTHDGRNFVEKTLPWVVERRRQAFHGFSPGDIERFISYLNQVENNILDHKHHKGMAPASSDISPQSPLVGATPPRVR
jgi:DNA-binding MarR family transcriptional regulator